MPTTFASTIDGNDIYAKRAECDAAGNDLSTTYATKSEIPDGVPAVTSSDNNKVLKASYSGGVASYSWQTESGGGGGGGSYTAGTGIDITNDVISVDTSVVATQTDLADKEDAFAVGTGLEMDTSGATPTLQVEAPVDIVGGPGIVIDNPDGNTLRVSQQYPTDETVLFEDTGSTGTIVANVVLSESSTHFSKLEITLGWAGGGGSPVPGRLIFTCIPDGKGYGFAGYIGRDASVHHVLGAISTNGTSLALINCLDMYTSNNSSVSYQSFNNVLKVFKVVGIHRINGGN